MMQLPPPMTYQKHDALEIEAREHEFKRDCAGNSLPGGYLLAWMIIIVLAIVGYVLLGVMYNLV